MVAEGPDNGAAGARKRRLADFNAAEWSVLLPLTLVGFFINYDTALLTLAAPPIADGLEVDVTTFGIGVAVIRLAALASVGTLRLADRWGRRSVLLISVAAFALATGATAVAWSLAAFVAFQLVSRLFLTTEESLAGVVITEELRPDRRGAGLGLLGIIGTAGPGLAAAMLLFVEETPLGWRLFYVTMIGPLVIVMFLRRNLTETHAFGIALTERRLQPTWLPKLDPVHRRRLWRLGAVIGAAGMLDTTAFFYASELAQDQYRWDGLFVVIVFAAAPTTLAGFIAGGRLSDRLGRKPVTAVTVIVFGAGAVLVFTELRYLFAPGFFLLAGANAALQAVRVAYASELFPTEVRATAASVVGAVSVAAGSIGLAAVGLLAGRVPTNVSMLVLAGVCAASAIGLRWLPETAGVDLTARPAGAEVRRRSAQLLHRDPGGGVPDVQAVTVEGPGHQLAIDVDQALGALAAGRGEGAPQHRRLHRLGHAVELAAGCQHLVELPVVHGDLGGEPVVDDPAVVSPSQGPVGQGPEFVEVEGFGQLGAAHEVGVVGIVGEAVDVGLLHLIGSVGPPLVEQQVDRVLLGLVDRGEEQSRR